MLAAVTDDVPRPDEVPGGVAYQQCWKQAEADGGRLWDNATPEERQRLVTAAAVSRRRQMEQAERLGYPSIDAYLNAQLERSGDPSLYRQPTNGHVLGIDAADLLGLDLPPLRWLVPDLVPEGTTILAAPPKVGKSCFVYQMAVEAAVGGDVLDRRVTPGSVLYLALEDGKRRGQDRLRVALRGRTMPRGRLEVRWEASRIGAGLEDEVEKWLDTHDDAAMVAVDTLGKVRPRSTGKQGAYEVDVQDLARLQSLFRDRTVALVIVHHSRKETSDDFLTSVSGTYGITGSADTIVVLRRKRLEQFGSVLTTGRDIADAEVQVRFVDGRWETSDETPPPATQERRRILNIIETAGPIFPQAIADQLDLGRTSVANMVKKLYDAGAITKTATGYVVGKTIAWGESALNPRDDSDDSSDSDDGDSERQSSSSQSPQSSGIGIARARSVGDRLGDIFDGSVQ